MKGFPLAQQFRKDTGIINTLDPTAGNEPDNGTGVAMGFQ